MNIIETYTIFLVDSVGLLYFDYFRYNINCNSKFILHNINKYNLMYYRII